MKISLYLLLVLSWVACVKNTAPKTTDNNTLDSAFYPSEILEFTPDKRNPVFTGTGTNTWDEKIRERGYILYEEGEYRMWYTGFRDKDDTEMHLGYATSQDGLSWKRYEKNPIYDAAWVEDIMVVKDDGTYYMFAEGKNDIAHLLTSTDRIHWTEQGNLDIRYVNGEPLTKGAYGTPTAWKENGTWYLFYERGDLGIWLATSTDLKIWKNIQDEPVIQIGPEAYDKYGVAVNQIIKLKGKYYAYYHATAYEDWHEWSSCVAISDDLIHWTKYKNNPIMKENKSSPILVYDGTQYRLYTMHDKVAVHFPAE
jgi:beta-1,2-mannobiose phosphorylase / 1,2-beta-oligomannan phosphorylase